MDIIKGKYENIFSYKSVEIPFYSLNFTLFKGNSGTGKSSIFDIMCWILFGSTARKKYKSFLRDVPDRPKSGYGQLSIITDDGKEWLVKRKAGRGKGVWIYKVGADSPELFRTSTQTQEFIEQLLGMNFRTFLNIAYFSQGDVGKFLISESSERIQLLAELLNFEQFDKIININASDVKNVSYDIENYKGQSVVLRNKIDGVDVRKMARANKMRIASLEKTMDDLMVVSQYLDGLKEKKRILSEIEFLKISYNNQLANNKHTLVQIKTTIDSLKQKKDNSAELKEKIKVCQDRLNGYDELKRMLVTLRNEVQNLYNLDTKNESKIQTLKKEKKIHEDILKMEGCECPTCRNIVTKSNLHHIKSRVAEINKQIDKAVIRYNEANEQLKSKINDRDVADKKLDELNRVKAYETDLRNKLKDVEQRQDKIQEYVKQYNQFKGTAKQQLDEIKIQINRLKQDLEYYTDYNLADFDIYSDKYEKIEAMRIGLEKEISLEKYKIQEYYNDVKKLKEIEDGMKGIEDEYKIMMFWKDALPKIKVDMIGSVIPFIESETNKYLSQILPGKMVKFNVDSEKFNNKLDLMIYDYEHMVDRIYEGWSGGEKDKISLSVYLALNKLASLRSGKKVNFLILDEKFATIDAQSRGMIFEMLRAEYGNRKIWMISHIQDIDSEFREIVTVKKIDNVSKVDFIYN